VISFLWVSNYWRRPFQRLRSGHIFKLFAYHSSEHKSSQTLAPKGFQPKADMTAKKYYAVSHLPQQVFSDAFLAIFT